MPLHYKIDILATLKAKGYTTYTLRKKNILSESTIQKLRAGKGVSWDNIERLCSLLDCQPGDLMEYTRTPRQGNQPNGAPHSPVNVITCELLMMKFQRQRRTKFSLVQEPLSKKIKDAMNVAVTS